MKYTTNEYPPHPRFGSAIDVLAEFGAAALGAEPEPAVSDLLPDGLPYERAMAAWRAQWDRIKKLILTPVSAPAPGYNGCRIGEWQINWPDRVPALIVWSGQQSLYKIVKERQQAVREGNPAGEEMMHWQVPMQGTTGLDGQAAADSIDVGYSRNAVDEETMQRPGAELLAVFALQMYPIISRGPGLRDNVGIIDTRGVIWEIGLEKRSGGKGYYRLSIAKESKHEYTHR